MPTRLSLITRLPTPLELAHLVAKAGHGILQSATALCWNVAIARAVSQPVRLSRSPQCTCSLLCACLARLACRPCGSCIHAFIESLASSGIECLRPTRSHQCALGHLTRRMRRLPQQTVDAMPRGRHWARHGRSAAPPPACAHSTAASDSSRSRWPCWARPRGHRG